MYRKNRAIFHVILVLCVICAAPLHAGDNGKTDKALDELLSSDRVVYEHPDLWYRQLGRRAYERGHPADALPLFMRAARYADKPSQAIIATMYWNGDGVERNRPLAYAWMDLAANRGYPELLAQRERYWKELTPAERVQALEVGRQIYDEFDNAIGMKRLAGQLGMEFRHAYTGSRTGFQGTLDVLVGPNISEEFRQLMGNPYGFERFAEKSLYQVDDYVRLKDLQWLGADRFGRITVGPLQAAPSVDPQANSEDKGSGIPPPEK